MKHLGPTKSWEQVTKLDVERYQQTLMDQGFDTTTRVEPLKTFLVEAKRLKWTDVNLGAGLRIKRRGGNSRSHREEAKVVELTQEGLDQLHAELENLESTVAPQVREMLAAAYEDRDFRENAPYDEAKRRMGEVQGRINSLKEQIKAARVVERTSTNDRVGLGSKVVLRDLQYDEEITYVLVGPGEVDTRKGKISIASPVGSAVKDCTIGEVVEVVIPTGVAKYRVEKIEKA